MRLNKRNYHLQLHFDSLTDFIESAGVVPEDRAVKRLTVDFHGADSIEDAMELARQGSPRDGMAGLDFAQDKILEMERDLIAQGFQWRYSEDAGGSIDMARYLSGDDDYLMEFYLDSTTVTCPVVTLVIGSGVSCAISTESITAHGCRIVALVDAIESTGKNVELYIDYTTAERYNGTSGVTARQSILLKKAGEFLDAGQMFHALTHASMFRVLGFNNVGHFPDKWFNELNQSQSYGHCVLRPDMIEPEDYPEGTVYLKPLERNSEAEWSIETQLKDLGLWRGTNNDHRPNCECLKCAGELI